MDLNQPQKLSIIIPVYNEEKTIKSVITEVLAAQLPSGMQKEIIIVNDGSNDSTQKILESYTNVLTVINLVQNQGKGFSVRQGILNSTGDLVVIQDADLEYDPNEISNLLSPIINDKQDAVNGTRYIGSKNRQFVYYINQFANIIFTVISNILTGYRLTDICSCYKIIRGDLARQIARECQSNGFGIEAELIARLAKHHAKIRELPISYHGRSKKEGKHLKAKDGIIIFYTVLRYNLFK